MKITRQSPEIHKKFTDLLELLGEVNDLRSAADILNWDQTTQRLTPSIEKRTIALVSGTWEGFEKGQEVTAEIVDDQGYLDSIKIFYGLAESYYNMVYLPMIKETKFQTDAPMISVEKPKRAQVLISSQRIVVMQQADQVRIKTNIFPPNK